MTHRIILLIMFACFNARCDAAETDWIELFDGKTLNGWTAQAKGDVKVVDGEIHLLSSKANLWLVHQASLNDFELEVEARMPDDTYNSGIGFRCTSKPKVRGYQCEIDRGKSGMIYAIGSGWVWPKGAEQTKDFKSKSKGAFDNSSWNQFRIRCEGSRIQIWINGKPIADVQDNRFQAGSVALQHHGKGGVHRFRNVRIRSPKKAQPEPKVSSGSAPWFSVASEIFDDEALVRPHDVELHGDFAFVPGKGGTIAMVDISDPNFASVAWYRNDAELLDDSETVLPVGDHLLLGARDFHLLNAEDPQKCSIMHTIRDRDRVGRINGLVRRGDHVFGASKTGWINVFEIDGLDAPKLFGALEVREKYGFQQPHDIALFGSYVVIVDAKQFRGPGGSLALFKAWDCDGRLLAMDQWTLAGIVQAPELIGANRMQISGSCAYVAGSWNPQARQRQGSGSFAKLSVVDFTDPTQPRIVASLPFSDQRGPNGLTVAGSIVFLAGGNTVDAIDISDPRNPALLGSQGMSTLSPGHDNAHDLVYRDGHLFVSCQSENRLVVLKVINQRIAKLART